MVISKLHACLQEARVAALIGRTSLSGVAALHMANVVAAWNAIAPKRIAATREVPGATMVLHSTKGWRRISHKRLGIA